MGQVRKDQGFLQGLGRLQRVRRDGREQGGYAPTGGLLDEVMVRRKHQGVVEGTLGGLGRECQRVRISHHQVQRSRRPPLRWLGRRVPEEARDGPVSPCCSSGSVVAHKVGSLDVRIGTVRRARGFRIGKGVVKRDVVIIIVVIFGHDTCARNGRELARLGIGLLLWWVVTAIEVAEGIIGP